MRNDMTEYNEGDLVEAVKGETVIRGLLVNICGLGRSLCLKLTLGIETDLIHLEANGFTITVIEKAAPVVVLPTEPGAYGYAGWSDILILNNLGEWHNQWASRIDVTALEGSGLTRLAPVSETAKKVLDRVRKVWPLYNDRDLDVLAAEFGVTA